MANWDFISLQSLELKNETSPPIRADHQRWFLMFLWTCFSSLTRSQRVDCGVMNWYKRFGIPGSLVSDRGSQLTERVLKDSTPILQANYHLMSSYLMEQLKFSADFFNLLLDHYSQRFKYQKKDCSHNNQLLKVYWIRQSEFTEKDITSHNYKRIPPYESRHNQQLPQEKPIFDDCSWKTYKKVW